MNRNDGESTRLISIEKKLFTNAMKSNWKEVMSIYENNPEAENAKITRSGDTALHIAISDGQESTVVEMVRMVKIEALRIKNEMGNTPLHLAAYLGNVNMCKCIMCKCIATRDPTLLLGIRNQDKETPLFLAVLHGRKDAFLSLNSFCRNVQDRYAYCRGKDGDTILHSAIDGQYFEIAFHIIRDYENLLNSVNEKGFSPLHILATKPSAFKSGSHIRGFHQLIYHCTFVDEINLDGGTDPLAQRLEYDHQNAKYPQNYQTCMGIFLFTRNLVWVLMGCSRQQHDEECAKFQQQPVHEQEHGLSENMNNQQQGQQQPDGKIKQAAAGPTKLVPDNWTTCFTFVKFLSKAMFVILGLGSSEIERIREKKEKHVWSVQIMRKLIEHASLYEYELNGKEPPPTASGQTPAGFDFPLSHVDDQPASQSTNGNGKDGKTPEMEKKETPLLIAAKNGIQEMVEEILDQFPVAVDDMNVDKKNIVLLAVENRQPHIYKFLQERKIMKETIFRKTDKDGNSALHLAAMMGDHRPWLTPGAALQMQWEIKWYEYVKKSMPMNYFVRHNIEGQTPSEIFNSAHEKLVEDAGRWLKETSQSCSVVAALIATVAFATSATVPGGIREGSGKPTLQNEAAFSIFALSSLVALCFSVTAVVLFLAILTSRYQDKDFRRGLPNMLLFGLTSLFVSIGSMLLSFCAGHFFVLKEKLKYAGFSMYAITCLPVTFFAFAQFRLYIDLFTATIRSLPQRRSR